VTVGATAVWYWPLFGLVLVGGFVHLVVAGRRGMLTTSPLISAHPRAFVAAVLVLIGGALAWLIAQSLS
jgi:hypothetical protein